MNDFTYFFWLTISLIIIGLALSPSDVWGKETLGCPKEEKWIELDAHLSKIQKVPKTTPSHWKSEEGEFLVFTEPDGDVLFLGPKQPDGGYCLMTFMKVIHKQKAIPPKTNSNPESKPTPSGAAI